MDIPTLTFQADFTIKQPIAVFTPPFFNGINNPDPRYFYSQEEAEKFLNKMPKDWLTKIILGNRDL
jgi:hypothetical protein